MKRSICLLTTCLLTVLLASWLVVPLALAQSDSTPLAKSGTWEFGLWGQGGTGLGASSDWQFVSAGARVGRTLTGQIGHGALRGNFEWAADVIPLDYLLHKDETLTVAFPSGTVTGKRANTYGFGLNPVILKWNFTAGKRFVPFIAAEGGLLFTSRDVPLPDTSNVNFTPGGAFGVYIFMKNRHAVEFSGHVTHISNASLGEHNPGFNATLQFRLGYHWFK